MSRVRITIAEAHGSTPREVGAAMLVDAEGRFTGTIGGGVLEWQALAEAQRLLQSGEMRRAMRFALGPDLGQCCGGRVTLSFERVEDEARLEKPEATPVLLFGAGHVGRALVLALAPLPFDVRWIDPRPNAFPQAFPPHATPVAPAEPVTEIASAGAGSLALILTHSHALDLALCDAALRRDDLPFVGVIGSETKRARFLSQLRAMGHAEDALKRLTCPIGFKDLGSKEPAFIAAGVAVQLLQERAKAAASRDVSRGLHVRSAR
ncbi:MAG: xanthine dehydrogenase accessory protein XdhC [Methylobacterium sp.]|nr:xanthine dehydrogenase accessory protein XdhC [Methylobacterium sp.]MCA3604136.1 xanthine dehydrogenase accessory protein XdhC [Methylobacterium sp.]MCA3615461.1 xanthine dehydrogenase accessory protein XdhC [Methylobacterium sp.]